MKIPKIIHQIWIGPKPPPKFMNSWKKHHPEYQHILWDNEIIKEMFPLVNQHLYDQYNNERANVWNGRSNLLRLEILKRFGGIYIDADCHCLRPMEGNFLNDDFFAVYANEKARKGIIANGVIGCVPEHPIIIECISRLKKQKKLQQPSHLFSGPTFLTRVIGELKTPATILPSYYFYPHFYRDGINAHYEGDFKPFSDHKWGTTKNLYGKI